MYPVNTIKEKLKKGETVFGVFGMMPSPQVQEIMGYSGLDFTIIDFEHGTHDLISAENMMRSQNLTGAGSVVRVPEEAHYLISKVLDMGVNAVQIPQVSTKEAALKAVSTAKFPPQGSRGAAHVARAARYASMDRMVYFGGANENTVIIIQIEGIEGCNNADEIMTVPGIDVIFIGPHDLAHSLGIPGQIDSPILEAKMEELVNKAKSHGKWVGTYVETTEKAKKWAKLGVQYIAFSSDVEILYLRMKQIVSELKG